MATHTLLARIEAADRVITAEDAVLVVEPGPNVAGKAGIRGIPQGRRIRGHTLRVGQGRFEVLETGDTAPVVMESTLDHAGPDGGWLCAIDNPYGTGLLEARAAALKASPARPRSARGRSASRARAPRGRRLRP